ncbi:MAG: hypothetical protein U1E02_10560 [Hydrogenophaga sp.]|nr:hypothetical protein [Hydrogenophaga sp.]
MAFKKTINNNGHKLATFYLFLSTAATLGMSPHTPTPWFYPQKEASNKFFSINKQTFPTYQIQLFQKVRETKTFPTPEALSALADFYCDTTFESREKRDMYRKELANIVAPLIDTLIERNDDSGLNQIAFIFVGSSHQARVNNAIHEMMARRSGFVHQPTPPHVTYTPSAPAFEQPPQENTILNTISRATAAHDIAGLTNIAETNPEYAAIVTDALNTLLDTNAPGATSSTRTPARFIDGQGTVYNQRRHTPN